MNNTLSVIRTTSDDSCGEGLGTRLGFTASEITPISILSDIVFIVCIWYANYKDNGYQSSVVASRINNQRAARSGHLTRPDV